MTWSPGKRGRIAQASPAAGTPATLAGAPEPAPGAEEHHVARGALLQQASQVWGALCMLLIATLLGRSLSLAEFGVYGLLIGLVAWLVTIQVAVEAAVVRTLAPAGERRDAVFSSALVVYCAGGLLFGAAFAALGSVLVEVLGIPAGLRGQAHAAVIALAVVTAIGWPGKGFQDALRALHLFGSAAGGEIAAFTTLAIGVGVLLAVGAPLWTLVALVGSLSIVTGLWCGVLLLVQRVDVRFRPSLVSRADVRHLVRGAAEVLALGLADLVVYALDRVVLGAFRPASTIGLYEAAARPSNLLRQLQGSLGLTVMPVASGYLAAGDRVRLRELVVRGTRYIMTIVAPLTVTLIVLAAPLLEVWLGVRFRPAALTLAIMAAPWLLSGGTTVVALVLLAKSETGFLNRYAWSIALSNLVLSIGLTAWLGLEGVALGTAIPYLLGYPVFLRGALARLELPLGPLVREAWVPAYAACLATAAVLIPLRLATDLSSLPALVGAAVAGLGAAWALVWWAFLTDGERRLVRALLRSPLRPA